MVALIIVLEAFVSRHDADLSHPWASDWRHGARAARLEAPGCQVLCFGDSLVKYGVVPRLIEDRSGKSTYNLALGAGPAPTSYFLLRQALEAGARPRAILVDYVPHLLSRGLHSSVPLMAEVSRLRDCLDLGRESRDPDLFFSLLLARFSPTIKNRSEIRLAILAALRGESRDQRRWLLRAARRNWKVNRGAYVAARDARTQEDPDLVAGLCPETWRCHPLNAVYVRKFLALASARDITVFWLVPPLSPEIDATRARKGLDILYTRFIEEFEKQFPNLVVVDARRSGYDRSVHADSLHLDRRGASVFSEDLAEVLLRHQTNPGASPRWVQLPRFRDRPCDLALEDNEQSQLALSDPGKRARR
ncbi:MAG: hypothetical protein NVSMB9_16660 [Isosphaeraceae bacterium]